MKYLTHEQNSDLWKQSIALMKAMNIAHLSYTDFKEQFMSLVDIDAIRKKYPDQTIAAERTKISAYSGKISYMKREWEFLAELTSLEVYNHPMFNMCSSRGHLAKEVIETEELYDEFLEILKEYV